jgi:hypothetical protein
VRLGTAVSNLVVMALGPTNLVVLGAALAGCNSSAATAAYPDCGAPSSGTAAIQLDSIPDAGDAEACAPSERTRLGERWAVTVNGTTGTITTPTDGWSGCLVAPPSSAACVLDVYCAGSPTDSNNPVGTFVQITGDGGAAVSIGLVSGTCVDVYGAARVE